MCVPVLTLIPSSYQCHHPQQCYHQGNEIQNKTSRPTSFTSFPSTSTSTRTPTSKPAQTSTSTSSSCSGGSSTRPPNCAPCPPLMSSLMPTCLWPPTSHRYIDVVVDDGVDVVVYIDFVVVLTNADMCLATYVSQVYLRCC